MFTTLPKMPLKPILALHHKLNLQGAIFEREANLKDSISLNLESSIIDFSLEDALRNERIIALSEETKATICEHFGLCPDKVENPCVYWHNAWKMKIYKAIPYEGCYVRIGYIDENPKEGENYYYV